MCTNIKLKQPLIRLIPMLIDFSVKNFRSFKEKQTLTLVKDAGKEMIESNTFQTPAPASTALVRSAAIYGANSAGKSNLIDAIRVFQKIIRESSRKTSINDTLDLAPFRLSTDTETNPPSSRSTLLCMAFDISSALLPASSEFLKNGF